MTKAEMVERYGLEWYEQHKAHSKQRIMQQYQNDSEYRESHKAQAKRRRKQRYQNDQIFRESEKVYHKARYVKDGRIDLVENYELAVKDNFKGWDIHHRLELHPDCSVRFRQRSLVELNLYYDRPPSELIWLRRSEHRSMHGKSRAKK